MYRKSRLLTWSRFLMLGAGFSCLLSCQPQSPTSETKAKYFDIKGYFEKEAQQLQQKNPAIQKQVEVDGEKEEKTLQIAEWHNELQLFIASDINKPAWKEAYHIDSLSDGVLYTAKDSTYKTQKMQILWDQMQTPVRFEIHNRNQNMLYTSEERLIYEPENGYEIQKNQDIRWISSKKYLIKGTF
jgi:hypothetical protein